MVVETVSLYIGTKHVVDAIERLHDEFKRRIKTQTVLPSAEKISHVVLGIAGGFVGSGQYVVDSACSPPRQQAPQGRLGETRTRGA